VKEKADRALHDLTQCYLGAFNESPATEADEALSLGVDGSTAYNYLRADVQRHLPAGLVPLSLFRESIMIHLAEKCGGVFVPSVGKLNGTSNDELASILKLCAHAVRETDPAKRAQIFKQIETKAARAAKEESI
jgi:hypothetical protein